MLSRRTRDQVLVTLSSADLGVIEQALSMLDSAEAQRCLAALREDLNREITRDDYEVAEAWADQASVQVRAITVYGDPVDMGADQARSYARKILAAADEADG